MNTTHVSTHYTSKSVPVMLSFTCSDHRQDLNWQHANPRLWLLAWVLIYHHANHAAGTRFGMSRVVLVCEAQAPCVFWSGSVNRKLGVEGERALSLGYNRCPLAGQHLFLLRAPYFTSQFTFHPVKTSQKAHKSLFHFLVIRAKLYFFLHFFALSLLQRCEYCV